MLLPIEVIKDLEMVAHTKSPREEIIDAEEAQPSRRSKGRADFKLSDPSIKVSLK